MRTTKHQRAKNEAVVKVAKPAGNVWGEGPNHDGTEKIRGRIARDDAQDTFAQEVWQVGIGKPAPDDKRPA